MDHNGHRLVLVVDSDFRSLQVLVTLCRSLGWSVRTAGRAEATVAPSTAEVPSHLVVEATLPDGSAFSLLRRLRDLNPFIEDLFANGAQGGMFPRNDVDPRSRSLERAKWEHIRAVLSEVGGNVSEAARVLGVHRRSLQRALSRRRAEAPH